MAQLTKRFGNPLMALTTHRPADASRGEDLVHLDLQTPASIEAQVTLWETGARGPLIPREAASLLWGLPVASHLNGRTDAWREVPEVRSLLPGLDVLAEKGPEQWPANQKALRDLVATAAPGAPTWVTLEKGLEKVKIVESLNDLVLIFKYAAIGRRRPLRLVADLYRLARTLMAATGGPAKPAEVVAWLTAPLVVPRALAGPLGPAGPKPVVTGQPDRPVVPTVSLTSPTAIATLARLETELGERARAHLSATLATELRAAGVSDRESVSRITRAAGFDPGILSAPLDRRVGRSPLHASLVRQRPRYVRAHLYGASLLIDVDEATRRVAGVRRSLAKRVTDALPANLRDLLREVNESLENLDVWPDLLQKAVQSPSYLEPTGRSDLLLVRQTTTGYRRAEIAYIENVMVGEKRDREHTHRILSREETFESVERETEETRDLQTTDRAELSREVSKVVSEDLKVQGSVEVTSRGPTQVVASAGVSYQRSTEEAAKAAESYARETIERAVKRTMEKITRESRRMFEQETVELNRHGFEHASNATDHVSGVYQFLERVSRAKLFWYGERELYDLLIPEPAALIWHLALSRKEIQITVEAPDEDLFNSITVDNIADMREDVIRAFRVTDMPRIPDNAKSLPVHFSASGGGEGDANKYAMAKEVQIPDGYTVSSVEFAVSAEVEDEDHKPNGGAIVGGRIFLWEMTLSGNKGESLNTFTFTPELPGPTIAVALNADNYTTLSGTFTFHMGLTEAARRDWALAAYGRVAERYELLRREYAEGVIQSNANRPQETASLPEGSRRALQQLVRAELQRAAIDIMRNAPVNFDLIADFPYAQSDGTLGTQPVVDLDALQTAQPEVRFLQQAFEWEHLGWVLYPYFWGRRSEWSRTVVTQHPDPDFLLFLNSGAARLQVPVRPGFEDLVKHFMETGEVYGGDGMPKMGDPGYVTFIDEQMTSLGAPGEEVPWPPEAPREWDVVAPTSLVLLRPLTLSQLPTWNPVDGAEI